MHAVALGVDAPFLTTARSTASTSERSSRAHRRRRAARDASCGSLGVHARSVVAGVIDVGSGEVRSLRVAPGNGG
jgi:hypothetical protein